MTPLSSRRISIPPSRPSSVRMRLDRSTKIGMITAGLLALALLGPIAFAVLSMRSTPQSTGASAGAWIAVGLTLLVVAAPAPGRADELAGRKGPPDTTRPPSTCIAPRRALFSWGSAARNLKPRNRLRATEGPALGSREAGVRARNRAVRVPPARSFGRRAGSFVEEGPARRLSQENKAVEGDGKRGRSLMLRPRFPSSFPASRADQAGWGALPAIWRPPR
jgi:hypothetical protein